MGLKSAITNRDNEEEYGHLVHEAMKQVIVCLYYISAIESIGYTS